MTADSKESTVKKKDPNLAVILFIAGMITVLSLALCYDIFRYKYIEWQLQQAYGVTFFHENKRIEDNNFTVSSSGGIEVNGKCDFFGNVKSESYVNYFYAEECAKHIEEEIGQCFGDHIIITDLISRRIGRYCFEFGSIKSYEDYMAAVRTLNRNFYALTFRVYLKDAQDQKHIAESEKILTEKNEYCNVYYFTVPEDLYDVHKNSSVRCYSYGDTLEGFMHILGDENYTRMQKLIIRREGQITD